jgi:uncharacterized membrane protein YfhO
LNYKPNHLTYEYTSSSEQLLVFSEIFYDLGWTAYIDGEEAKHFRVNYILRGMKVPTGEHKIEFVYSLKSYDVGRKDFSSIICFYYFATSVRRWLQRIKNEKLIRPSLISFAVPLKGGQFRSETKKQGVVK